MIQTTRILFTSLLFLLTGCDGHVRVLYLKPPQAEKPPWSIASVVIQIEGDEDVLAMVANVAMRLNLKPDSNAPNTWLIQGLNTGSFHISVTKEGMGYWTIGLLDWPSSTRSQYSVKAEEAIRNAVTHPPGQKPLS